DTPLKNKCALTCTNLLIAELIELYVAKRRKDNTRKAIKANIKERKEKKIGNKDINEENNNKSEKEKETNLDNKSKDNEHEEENLLAQLYLYCEF
ncbi:22242_t:CDS:2, partial [Gigaspora margarita]